MIKLERKRPESSSIAISEIIEEIDRAAGSNARVLISGSAAIRKEVIARRIHEQGARCSGPFVSMTCRGVRSDVLGSLLFGADLGTLFMDEIGELDSRLQEALLRFVETGEFLCGVSAPNLTTSGVRIITASGRDLHNEVIAGRFNDALFYRLNIIHIVVPERHGHDQGVPRRSEMQRRFRLELDVS